MRTERGIQIEVDETLFHVEVIRQDIMRLRINHQETSDVPSSSVCMDDAPTPEFWVEETEILVAVHTQYMSLRVYRSPVRIEGYRHDGTLLFSSYGEEIHPSQAYGTLNDGFTVVRKAKPGDLVFGLGQKTGRLNRKGRAFELWNTDILGLYHAESIQEQIASGSHPHKDPTSTDFDPYYISIPFFYYMDAANAALSGYFIDNTYRAHFDFSPSDRYQFYFYGGPYIEYIFAGPQMSSILEGYTWLTGRTPPPPIWSLGHHQCRWHPYTQHSLLQLARTYRQKALPCEALWLDIDHMDEYRVYSWDRQRFPDPETMLATLKNMGFEVVTIVDPGVKIDLEYDVYDEGRSNDYFCQTEGGAIYTGAVWPGRTAFPDFVQGATRGWWAGRIAAHVRIGIGGIWNDMNEPATGAIDPSLMRFDRARYPHARFHNEYALLMAMATREGLERARPGMRPFILSRAGSAGIQRYCANWLGDNQSRWDHLWMSIPMALGLGLSGQAFVGADVGGFAGNSSPELLMRWYQCAALTPFFRNHAATGTVDQYPWSFGAAVEDICRRAMHLRYGLLPYIYTMFMQAGTTGAPIQRPMIYAFQSDPKVRELDDQYLFGDQLLVAPIYTPQARHREVYLPEGTWHHWHTGDTWQGPQSIVTEAPVEYIPLYARGGAVIPTWPTIPQTLAGYQAETLDLNIFIPAEDGKWSSALYEDDGLTDACQHGAYLNTLFVFERTGNHFELSSSVEGQSFPEFRRQHFRIVFHGKIQDSITIDGKPNRLERGTLFLPNRGENFQILGAIE